MEAQAKQDFKEATQEVATPTPEYFPRAAAASSPDRLISYILRVVAVILTLIATIVMGVAKQSVTVITGVDPSTGAYVADEATAKSTHSNSFVYFIVANVLVFVYSSVSLALSVTRQANPNKLNLFLSFGDLIVVVLLYSSNGAAIAIAILAENGNSHLQWVKICNYVGKFCAHITASIVLSMIASFAYVMLILLSILAIHKRAR